MRFAGIASLSTITFTALMGLSTAALAGPTYIFSTSTGTQPSDVGVITLTQDGADAVIVDLQLMSGYGIINNLVPFAFDLNVSGGLSIDPGTGWTTPPGGTYTDSKSVVDQFSLDTAGGTQPGVGTFNVALGDTAKSGSSSAYFGDLEFTLSRPTGLSTSNFISNGTAYFTADLSDGSKTGAQAWDVGIDPPSRVPEPITVSMFGAGLVGAWALRRRKTNKA